MNHLLIAAGASPENADIFAPYLTVACRHFNINRNLAMFIAQVAHESGNFTRLVENLNYTSASRIRAVWPSRFKTEADAMPYVRNPMGLANRVYSNRLGNGDERSGDGGRFVGRGLIQLTGRDNYKAASEDIGTDYVAQPGLVAQPQHASLTAAWFWAKNGCNELTTIDATTRRINGPAMLGAQDRRDKYAAVRAAM